MLSSLLNKGEKIFVLSFQRTGTTSVGQFFKRFNYKVATNDISRKNLWGYKWYIGDFNAIFDSPDFKRNTVFEDGPWFFPEFYKYLFHNFPNAKFILFKRNPEKWFNSMLSHSNEMNPGNSFVHAKVYRREEELNQLVRTKYPNINIHDARNLLSLKEMKDHYTKIYCRSNDEIITFFKRFSSKSLFLCDLEDDNKWIKLGNFFDIKVPANFDSHVNKTTI